MKPDDSADPAALLVVDGAVANPLRLGFDDLAALPAEAQIADVAPFHPGRDGRAVDLRALLDRAIPRPEARFLALHADRDDFHVAIALDAIRDRGMIVYGFGDGPLGVDRGGPIRFLVRDPGSCRSDEVDDCANVKHLSRIELTTGRGRDTRPEDEAAHAALHARQSGA